MTSPISDAILKWFSFLKNDVLVKRKHRFTLAKTLFSTLENDVFCRRKRYYDYLLASVYGFDSIQKGQKFSVFLMLFSYFLPLFVILLPPATTLQSLYLDAFQEIGGRVAAKF